MEYLNWSFNRFYNVPGIWKSKTIEQICHLFNWLPKISIQWCLCYRIHSQIIHQLMFLFTCIIFSVVFFGQSTTKWCWFHFVSMTFDKVDLFKYDIYFPMNYTPCNIYKLWSIQQAQICRLLNLVLVGWN